MTLAERSGSFLRVVGRGHGRRAAHVIVVVAVLAVLVPWVAWPAPSQAAMAAPTVQELPELPDFSEMPMVMGANGNPIIAYFSTVPPAELYGNTQVLTVLFRGDPTCSVGNTSVTPEQTPRMVGIDIDITLDPAGNPVVVYSTMNQYGESRGLELEDGPLEMLRCTDPTCSADTSISLVDPPATAFPLEDVYSTLQVEVGANDVPTIFTNIEYDSEGGAFEGGSGIVACLNPACSETAPPVNFDFRITTSPFPAMGTPFW